MYKELLKLARIAIKAELNGKEIKITDSYKKSFNKNGACFVTLTIDRELRGCIGTLEAHQELWKDVIDNSLHAAFDDPRFSPLDKSELEKIKIEISILTEPKRLDYNGPEDLLKKIDKKMGIILRKGYRSATFLPQVWDDLPDKQDFLGHLCLKAGLNQESWKEGCEVWFYRVVSVKEE